MEKIVALLFVVFRLLNYNLQAQNGTKSYCAKAAAIRIFTSRVKELTIYGFAIYFYNRAGMCKMRIRAS